MTRYLLVLFYLLLPLSALAQSWPTQPVRVMVGFPPGGTTDVIGRLVANELSEQLGKPFVVENKMVSKPQIVAKFADLGAEPLSGTPERAATFIRTEQDKWERIIREVGIKLN
jgi:tripartite-type tricarboxylate transporter receptor subunit TctC